MKADKKSPKMKVVYVDWAPTEHKSDIYSGYYIRRYYAWKELNKSADIVIPFRKKKGNINWEAIVELFQRDSKIWVEYGCGAVAHLCVLLASFIQFRKTLILNVHDFVIQHKDTTGKISFFKKVRLQIIEQLLLKRANVIILPARGLLDWFNPKKNQKILMMVPGVGEDELLIRRPNNDIKNKKIKKAVYFGSMRKTGMIPQIIEFFSILSEWELLLVGKKEGAKIDEKENVKYLGIVSHDKIQEISEEADVILIPIPKGDYFNIANHIKLGYSLISCKPVIASKLKGIVEYANLVGLEENFIYVDNWNLHTLKDALQKSQNLNINAEKTIEKMKVMAWEPRFRNAIRIAIETK